MYSYMLYFKDDFEVRIHNVESVHFSVSLAMSFLAITEKIRKNNIYISNLYWSFNLIKGSWCESATS